MDNGAIGGRDKDQLSRREELGPLHLFFAPSRIFTERANGEVSGTCGRGTLSLSIFSGQTCGMLSVAAVAFKLSHTLTSTPTRLVAQHHHSPEARLHDAL